MRPTANLSGLIKGSFMQIILLLSTKRVVTTRTSIYTGAGCEGAAVTAATALPKDQEERQKKKSKVEMSVEQDEQKKRYIQKESVGSGTESSERLLHLYILLVRELDTYTKRKRERYIERVREKKKRLMMCECELRRKGKRQPENIYTYIWPEREVKRQRVRGSSRKLKSGGPRPLVAGAIEATRLPLSLSLSLTHGPPLPNQRTS